jgi:hypothetical protein
MKSFIDSDGIYRRNRSSLPPKADGAASPPLSLDRLTMEALELLINDVFGKK